jgi:hypothetical protein
MLQLPTDSPAPPPPAKSAIAQPAIDLAPGGPAAGAVNPPAKPEPRHGSRAVAVPAARGVPEPQPQAQVPASRAAQSVAPAASVSFAQPAVTSPPAALRAAPDGAAAADTGRGLSPLAWVAGILVALGTGAAAMTFLRGRRRDDEVDAETYSIALAQAGPQPAVREPIPGRESMPGREPDAPLPAIAAVEDMAAPQKIVQAVELTPHRSDAQCLGAEEVAIGQGAASLPGSPQVGAFSMPAGPVPHSRAERDALLEAMVAAPPDAENPFTSRKGRLRRARIILQSLEQEQKEEAIKPFDWRTYNPSTSHPAPATPPRVTV